MMVPTYMNKPVNSTVQASQLNHVQVCQQTKTSYAFLCVYSKRNTSKISIIENSMVKHVYFIHIPLPLVFFPIPNESAALNGGKNRLNGCQKRIKS